MQDETLKNCSEKIFLCGQRDKNYVAEKGLYRLDGDKDVLLDSCEDIVFDGNGSDFVFEGKSLQMNCDFFIFNSLCVGLAIVFIISSITIIY